MFDVLQKTREWRNVDAQMFRNEIVPLNEPAVLRGVVAHWPAVRAALKSAQSIAEYVKGFDLGWPVELFMGDARIKGRFFYEPGVQGVNFERKKAPLATLIDQLLAHLEADNPPAIYAGAVPVTEFVPDFGRQNSIDLLPSSVMPRIWIGNAITVPAHYDLSANIACVVAGTRRFTFFPPEQLVNLYVGPLDFTLAGQPSSMVDLHAPDYERYPRFRHALAEARYAELEPGDAVFVPNLWWHHVESLAPFNVLVNYWWDEAKPWAGSPFECLVHALLSIRDLPPAQRAAWRTIFDHYIFQTGEDPAAHLPPESRGVLGPLTPALAKRMRMFLLQGLSSRNKQ